MSNRKTWFCSVVTGEGAVKGDSAVIAGSPNNLSAVKDYIKWSFYGFGTEESDFDLSRCSSDEDIKAEMAKKGEKINANEKLESFRLISREAKIGDRVFLSNYNGIIFAVGTVNGPYMYGSPKDRNDDNPRSKFIHSIGIEWSKRECVYAWRAWNPSNFTVPKGAWSEAEGDRIERKLKERLKLNVIYAGAPGTGKTYNLKYAAVDACLAVDDPLRDRLRAAGGDGLIKKKYTEFLESGRIEFVTFHQNYDYTDFIQGIRPAVGKAAITYDLLRGPLFRIANEAMCALEKGDDSNYVLIIDEINRGNVAKIFGEAITLIEESYRIDPSEDGDHLMIDLPGGVSPGGGVETVCNTFLRSGKFGLPSNLVIIGTMNSTDRSIQRLDAALRRRFDFKEVMPDASKLSDNPALKKFLEKVNLRLDKYRPGSGCQIGHGWLMSRGAAIPASNEQQLTEVFNNKIFPQLSEWFWDDPAALVKVFGGASLMVDSSTGLISKLPFAVKKSGQLVTVDDFLERFVSQKKADSDPDE